MNVSNTNSLLRVFVLYDNRAQYFYISQCCMGPLCVWVCSSEGLCYCHVVTRVVRGCEIVTREVCEFKLLTCL